MKSILFKLSTFTFYVLVFWVLVSPAHAQSGLQINEVCPSNVSGLINPHTGEYDDWIEILNVSGSAKDISGYGLSDDPLQPYTFTFPAGTILANNARVMVFASSKTKTRRITNWATVSSNYGSTTQWRRLAPTAATDTNWRNIGFNDLAWLPMTNSFSSSSTTVYLRKQFYVTDSSKVIQGFLNVNFEDGYVAYLNGVEIARNNVGTKGYRPLWNESARSSITGQDSISLDYDLIRSVLRTNNVLAIEVHKNLGSNTCNISSYLSFGSEGNAGFPTLPASPVIFPDHDYFNANFKLSRSGETIYLTDTSGAQADSFTYLPVESDNSVGYCGDARGNVKYFNPPTPAALNASGSSCYYGYTDAPRFYFGTGYYQNTITDTTYATSGAISKYTTNGDVPDLNDANLPLNLTISHTQTIRARSFLSGYLPSRVVTATYIIGEDIQLPFFSITTDSLNLWDYNTGIYVLGPNADPNYPYKGANFWQDWEKPATVQYFDVTKNQPFPSFDCNISIYGNYSQAKPQKSIEMKLSDRFGIGAINYSFIPDKPWLTQTDDIIMRNSGTDWNKVHFRDAFMERMLKNTHTGYIGAEPAAMYLNGEFWGVFTIHENHDENWQKYNYGISASDLNYLKEDGSSITVKEGTDSLWWAIFNYATNNTPTNAGFYEFLDARMDIENYADYFIAETFVDNGDWIGDWTNNIKMWSPRKPGGKLRYLVYDLDFGFGYTGTSPTVNSMRRLLNPAAYSNSAVVFGRMIENPRFRNYFINRYADLMNTEFLPNELDRVRASIEDLMRPDMPEHFNKWGSDTTFWQGYISTMENYYHRRPDLVRDSMVATFNELISKVYLRLEIQPAGAGRIQISTIIPPSFPWSGYYFHGNSVRVTAIPNPGYTFDHFSSSAFPNNTNQFVDFDYSSNSTIIAHFTGSPQSPNIRLSEINYHSSPTADCGDWIEIHNAGNSNIDLTGWKLRDEMDYHTYTFPLGTVIHPGEYLVIAEDLDKFNALYPNIGQVIGPLDYNFGNAGDMVRLFNHANVLIDSTYYQDLSPWPVEADGLGFTCERINFTGDPYDGNNWKANCIGGSPCRAYSPNSLGIPLPVTGNLNICPNGLQSTQLSVPAVPGFSYQWYNGANLLTGQISNVLAASQPGTYYALVIYQGCSAQSDRATVQVVNANAAPVVAPGLVCGTGSATLIASAPDEVYWFTTPTGGNPVSSGDTLVTPPLTSSVTYYAQTTMSCPSSRTVVPVVVDSIPAPPAVSDVLICGPGPVTLTASSSSPVSWYNAAVGGGLLNVGDTFSLPFLSGDTSFFVQAGNLCPSQRVVMNVQVSQSALPAVNSAFTCAGDPIVLITTCSDPVSWYDVPVGGIALSSGLTFMVTGLMQTDTFYVQSNAGCASARVPAIAYVEPYATNPVVRDTVVCGYGTVDLIATSSQQVYWYDSPALTMLLHAGNPFTTPYFSRDTTVTYYIQAGDRCKSDTVSIHLAVISHINHPATDTLADCSQPVRLCTDTTAQFWFWSNSATTSCIDIQASGAYQCMTYYANSCSVTDSFIVDCFTGVMDPVSHIGMGTLYPNPASGTTSIEMYARESSSVIIECVDMLGRVVQQTNHRLVSGMNSVELSVASMNSGVYMVRMIQEGNVRLTEKLVVR